MTHCVNLYTYHIHITYHYINHHKSLYIHYIHCIVNEDHSCERKHVFEIPESRHWTQSESSNYACIVHQQLHFTEAVYGMLCMYVSFSYIIIFPGTRLGPSKKGIPSLITSAEAMFKLRGTCQENQCGHVSITRDLLLEYTKVC